jgi:hypothetical protein
MTPPRLRTLLSLILLATAATLLLWSNGFLHLSAGDALPTVPDDTANRAAEASHITSQDTAATGVTPPAGTAARDVSLPSIPSSADLAKLSVVELLDLLGDRARAGDPQASCELTTALKACRFELLSRNFNRPSTPPNASEAELETFVNFHAGFQEARARDAERCADVGSAAQSEMLQFMAHAALAGHVDSLTSFMFAPERHAADFLRNPLLADLYRTRLWPALQRALAAGNPELAHTVLWQLTHPLSSSLSVILPEAYQDREIAIALLSLATNESEVSLGAMSHRAPPTAEAIEGARRWIDELFGGQIPDLSEVNRTRRRESGNPGCDSPSAWLPR